MIRDQQQNRTFRHVNIKSQLKYMNSQIFSHGSWTIAGLSDGLLSEYQYFLIYIQSGFTKDGQKVLKGIEGDGVMRSKGTKRTIK